MGSYPDLSALEQELKELIIGALALEDVAPGDIDAAEPLFGDGLGLDSIDALELGLALKKRYDVAVSSDSEETRQHFGSVRALAQFIHAQRAAV